MRITKLQSILALTLMLGFAGTFAASGPVPEEKSTTLEAPRITFNHHMPPRPAVTYLTDFACPARAFTGINNLVDEIFNETLHPFAFNRPFFSQLSPFTLASAPDMDIKNTGDQLQVVLSTPGLKPEDVNVFMEGNKLVIKGHHNEHSQNGWREESFIRTIDVPAGVDLSRIKKHYANGALTITVPRVSLSAAELPI